MRIDQWIDLILGDWWNLLTLWASAWVMILGAMLIERIRP